MESFAKEVLCAAISFAPAIPLAAVVSLSFKGVKTWASAAVSVFTSTYFFEVLCRHVF